MTGNPLCHFQSASVFQVIGDVGSAKIMVGVDGRKSRIAKAPLEHRPSVFAREAIGPELARPAASRSEKGGSRLIRELGCTQIGVQILLKLVVDRNFFLFAAFFPEPDERALANLKIILG